MSNTKSTVLDDLFHSMEQRHRQRVEQAEQKPRRVWDTRILEPGMMLGEDVVNEVLGRYHGRHTKAMLPFDKLWFRAMWESIKHTLPRDHVYDVKISVIEYSDEEDVMIFLIPVNEEAYSE